MKDIITVIAYKQNAVDTCRGCIMDTYDSALEMFSSDNSEAVIDFVANLRAADLDHYSYFNFTYLINGRCVHYDETCVFENISEEIDEEIFRTQEDIINRIRQQAEERTLILAKQREETKKRAQQVEKDKEQARKKKYDRELYKKLKAQFEGGQV